MNLKLKKIAFVAGLALVAVAPAKADVVYNFTTTSYGYTGPYTPIPPYAYTGIPLSLEFRLNDATVDEGSFVFRAGFGGAFNVPPIQSGDINGYDYLRVTGATIVPGWAQAALSVAMTFNVLGEVTSSFVVFNGISDEGQISGFGNLASGFIGSDAPGCNSSAFSRNCYVSGSWSQTYVPDSPIHVPEPASLALFGMGLFGLGFARRKPAA